MALSDGQGGTTQRTFFVEIDPVNDAPSAPGNVAIASSAYKALDTVIVTWEESDDFHWVQETPQEDLRYSVEYSLDGESWTPVEALQMVAYAAEWAFPAPTGDSDAFQVRIQAWDDGSYGNGHTSKGEPLASAWSLSGTAKLDNTPPTGGATASPTTPTNGTVEITVTASDTGIGASGTAGVTSKEGLTVTGTNGVYKASAAVNGTYTFVVADQVGNEQEVKITVGNIDRLPPVITHTASANEVYVGATIEIELQYADAEATAEYAMNEVTLAQYAISTGAAAPDKNSALWADYEESIKLSDRATYYVHARAEDTVGNEAVETFGPFRVINSPTVAPADNPQQSSESGVGSRITVRKVDAATGAALGGAEFVLRPVNGEMEDMIAVSNGAGEAIFEDVPMGKYVVIETVAPTGYIRSNIWRSLDIVEGRTHRTIVVPNRRSSDLFMETDFNGDDELRQNWGALLEMSMNVGVPNAGAVGRSIGDTPQ